MGYKCGRVPRMVISHLHTWRSSPRKSPEEGFPQCAYLQPNMGAYLQVEWGGTLTGGPHSVLSHMHPCSTLLPNGGGGHICKWELQDMPLWHLWSTITCAATYCNMADHTPKKTSVSSLSFLLNCWPEDVPSWHKTFWNLLTSFSPNKLTTY